MHVSISRDEVFRDDWAEEWNDLLGRCSSGNVLQTYQWQQTWWSHLSMGNTPVVASVRDGTKLVGLAPLVISSWEGFNHLGLIGNGTTDYEDIIIDDSADRQAVIGLIFDALQHDPGWDFFRFSRCPRASANLASLILYAKQRRDLRWSVSPFATAPRVSIRSNWSTYWKALSRNIRGDSVRRQRRLEESFRSVQFARAEDHDAIDRYIDAMIGQNITRHKDIRGDYTLLEDKKIQGFYRALAHRLFDSNLLDLQALHLDQSIAAVEFGARYAGRYYYIIPTFDDDFSQYSVGRLLLVRLLENSFEEGLSEFDLLFGAEPYKYKFATDSQTLMSISFYRRSARGILAYGWFDGIRNRLRSTKSVQRLLPWLRRTGVLRHVS